MLSSGKIDAGVTDYFMHLSKCDHNVAGSTAKVGMRGRSGLGEQKTMQIARIIFPLVKRSQARSQISGQADTALHLLSEDFG
jgi:hypothetical protein